MRHKNIALELTLLGGFRARLGSGEQLILAARKSRALLAYLALHPDRPHPRGALAALLWGDRPETKAHNSLSQAVTALRRALGAQHPPPLAIDADSLTFLGARAEVDALAFARLAASERVEELEGAEALYAGELLEGIGVHEPPFEDWLARERRRLEALAVSALAKLLDKRGASGEHAGAIVTAQRLLAIDPLQEKAHRALMRGFAKQGQMGLALSQYQACAEVLRRELGVEPDAQTRRLHDEIVARREAGSGESDAPPRETPPAGTDASSRIPREATELTLESPSHIARRRWKTGIAATALAVLAVGALLWVNRFGSQPPAPKIPETPSIVVLPFENMSDDPGQDYFADGMTEDLITDLAKISDIFIISRNSAFAYKDTTVPPDRIAEELGVRYVLEGSVRRAGDELRINAQLIDTATSGHLWAERFDGTTADVFALQDRITARIVDALALELLAGEARRLERGETASVAAHDAYLLGLALYYRRTPEDNARAAEHLEHAIAIDTSFSAAYTALAKVYVRAMIADQAYADALGIFWSDGYTRARQLLEHGMTRPNADFHVLRSWLALRKHQHARAIAEAEQAVALDPNDADALEALAEALIYAGRAEEGGASARQAMRRNPTLLGRPLYLLGLAAFARGDAAAAAAHVERAIQHAPARVSQFSGLLAAIRGELGDTDEARTAFRIFSEGFLNRPDRAWSVRTLSFANPRFHTWRRIDLAWSVHAFPFAEPRVLARLAAGLVAAGAAESVGGYLPLHRGNRLSGEEIRTLLFERNIEGRDFWLSEHAWRQQRGPRGDVEHSGYPIHPGLPTRAGGRGHIDRDRLCERWPALSDAFDICVAVFRVTGEPARRRWGDYVMVTDTGPHAFFVM